MAHIHEKPQAFVHAHLADLVYQFEKTLRHSWALLQELEEVAEKSNELIRRSDILLRVPPKHFG
jgi:hypothetical protein